MYVNKKVKAMKNISNRSIFFLNSISLAFLLLILSSCSVKNMKSYEAPKVLGYSSWTEWKEKTGWLDDENYIPDLKKINLLKQFLNENYSFVIFGTSFCDDCKENIPKIMKILDNLQIPDSNIRLYGLDYDLKEPSGYYKNFPISSTPSLFILKSEKIIGGISYPDYNWLDGIIRIIKKSNEL